jgi:hypothetical protein
MGMGYEKDQLGETYFSLLWSNLTTTNSMILVLLEKFTVPQPVKRFATVYGT